MTIIHTDKKGNKTTHHNVELSEDGKLYILSNKFNKLKVKQCQVIK